MTRREEIVVQLKKEVLEANLELVQQGLVTYTWGNVSAIHREEGLVVIKPSGVDYATLKVEDMVVLDFEGNQLEGQLKPSSDTPTHLALYKAFKTIGSVVHTHSEWATSWAQAKSSIPCYGTTHADYFYGEIICTRPLTEAEIKIEYEKNTGMVIIEAMEELQKDPLELVGILVANHGPFNWGKSPSEAVHNAKVMEEVAKMAAHTQQINTKAQSVEQTLLDKHFLRKHGKTAYYGQ